MFHKNVYNIKIVGEKTPTEKAIIEALRIRDVRQRQKTRQYPQPKSHDHRSSSSPSSQISFTKMSDMYGSDSPKNTEESSRHHKYDRDRASH